MEGVASAAYALPASDTNPFPSMRVMMVPVGAPLPQMEGWTVWGSAGCPPPAGLPLVGLGGSCCVCPWPGQAAAFPRAGTETPGACPWSFQTLPSPTSPPSIWGPGPTPPPGEGFSWLSPSLLDDGQVSIDDPGTPPSLVDAGPVPANESVRGGESGLEERDVPHRGSGAAASPLAAPAAPEIAKEPRPSPGKARRHRRAALRADDRAPPPIPPGLSLEVSTELEWVQGLVGVPLGEERHPLPDKSDWARVIGRIRGQTLSLALTAKGCMVLQQLLWAAPTLTGPLLLEDLGTDLASACRSLHGNYVVQALVEGCTSSCGAKIAEKLEGLCRKVATHRCGCRIFCRLFEHTSHEPATEKLASEFLELVATPGSGGGYHHYPFKSLLEHGSGRQKARAVEALCCRIRAGWWPEKNAVCLVKAALFLYPPNSAERAAIHSAVIEAELVIAGGSAADAFARGLGRRSTHSLFRRMDGAGAA